MHNVYVYVHKYACTTLNYYYCGCMYIPYKVNSEFAINNRVGTCSNHLLKLLKNPNYLLKII